MAPAAETVAPSAPIPDHVDPSLVVDFDFFKDPRYVEVGHPHETMIRLRDEVGRGIFWTPRNGGHWFITDHELLFEAARTPEIFSNVYNSFPPVPPEREAYYPPLSLDPPEHGAFRVPLMRAFAPGRINAMGRDIDALAIELVEAVKPRGHCEFVEEIAEPLPITIFMRLMGFPLERYKEFRTWVTWMTGGDPEKRIEAFGMVLEMARPLIAERRIASREDLLSWMMESEINGAPPTQEAIEGFCILMFGAGLDTVVNALSFSMEHLARNPELQDRLRADPSLIPEAMEELLRRFSVVFPIRRVAKDVEWHGARLKKDERCGLYFLLGNVDPTAFHKPNSLDIERDNKAHLTFAVGPHRCVGSHLARMELITLFEEWLKRMPNVRVREDQVGYRTGIVFAMTKLGLEWDANIARR